MFKLCDIKINLSCGEEDLPTTEVSDSIEDNMKSAVAGLDRALDNHPNLLSNLLILERSHALRMDYFENVQTEIQPYMREVVTTWMLEVCEEQHCEEQVFPLAVSYMDRYLAYQAIPNNQLQLLAVTSLLIASKFRQCTPFAVDLLCEYTENSFTPDDVKSWEVMLVKFFNWDLSIATAFDFVDPILARVHWGRSNPLIRAHALTLAAVCYTNSTFLMLQPSVIAVACIMGATRGLRIVVDANELTALVETSPSIAEIVMVHCERFVERQSQREPRWKSEHTGKSADSEDDSQSQPNTPTDVHDIHF